jgi:hypothetical protein
VASKRPDYAVGDVVLGYAGWQDLATSNGAGLRKLDSRTRSRFNRPRCSRNAGNDGLHRSEHHRPAEGG